MKLKYKAIRKCLTCDGKGYFTNPFDQEFRCECYKRTKAYKNRPQKSKEQIKRIKSGHDCLDCCSIEEWDNANKNWNII